MKVSHDLSNSPLRGSRNQAIETREKMSSGSERTRGQAGDRVELSVSLRDVEKLTATVASLPSTNSGKIESIKSRIADGTYRVSGIEVAEKMLRSMGIDVTDGEE